MSTQTEEPSILVLNHIRDLVVALFNEENDLVAASVETDECKRQGISYNFAAEVLNLVGSGQVLDLSEKDSIEAIMDKIFSFETESQISFGRSFLEFSARLMAALELCGLMRSAQLLVSRYLSVGGALLPGHIAQDIQSQKQQTARVGEILATDAYVAFLLVRYFQVAIVRSNPNVLLPV